MLPLRGSRRSQWRSLRRPARPPVRDVTIDFGDDSSESLGALSGGRSVAHVYERAGSHIVTAAARGAAGRRHASSLGIVVAAE